MSKKYYWLKLKDNFFENEDIKLVEVMPNGKDYILFYLKLLVKSIKTEGKLLYKDTIPYTPDMLATITNTNVDIVRRAVEIFIQLGMMSKLDDGALFLDEVHSMIGSETDIAQRVRKYRAKKSLQCNNLKQICNTEIDTEKEKEIDIELKKDKKEYIYVNEKCSNESKTKVLPAVVHDSPIIELFDIWKVTMNKPRAKLDNKRRELIKNKLKDFTFEDLREAIIGCSNSTFHMGNNDRNTAYNDLSLILRDNAKIETFIDFYHNPPKSKDKTIQEKVKIAMKNCNTGWEKDVEEFMNTEITAF